MRTVGRASLILLLGCLGVAGARAEAPPGFECGDPPSEAPPVAVDVVRQAEGELQVSWTFPTRESLWGFDFAVPPEIGRYRQWLRSVRDAPREEPDPSWEGYALERRIAEAVRTRRLGTRRPMNCLESTLLAAQIARTGVDGLRELVAYVLRSEDTGETRIYFLSGPDVLPPRDKLVKPLIRRDLESGWWLHAIIHNHTGPHPVAAPSASDARYGLFWAEDGARRFVVLNGIEAFEISAAELEDFLQQAEPGDS